MMPPSVLEESDLPLYKFLFVSPGPVASDSSSPSLTLSLACPYVCGLPAVPAPVLPAYPSLPPDPMVPPVPLRLCCLHCSKCYNELPSLVCSRPAPGLKCERCTRLKKPCEEVSISLVPPSPSPWLPGVLIANYWSSRSLRPVSGPFGAYSVLCALSYASACHGTAVCRTTRRSLRKP